MFANFAFASLLHPGPFSPEESLFYFYLAGHFISFSLFAPALFFARKASQLTPKPAALAASSALRDLDLDSIGA
jgi:hypothetical protein